MSEPDARTSTLRWYDRVARLYDGSGSAWIYRPMRREAIRQLRLAPGHTVVDLACGTGLNFPGILDAIGATGTLIGIDGSTGMLNQARRRVARRADTPNVHLVRIDARTLSRDVLADVLPPGAGVDRVLCTLGFSVLPDWEQIFERSFDLLAPGGRYAIMDAYHERTGIMVRAMSWIARADAQRRFWEPLQRRCTDFEERPFRHFGGRFLAVSGSRGSATL